MADVQLLISTLAKTFKSALDGTEVLRIINDPTGSPVSQQTDGASYAAYVITLTNVLYYTKTSTNNAITSALTNYYTITSANAAVVSTLTNYYTIASANAAAASTLTAYYTIASANAAAASTLTAYYTITSANAAIASSLTPYYTATSVNAVITSALTAYYTITSANAAITSALAAYQPANTYLSAISALSISPLEFDIGIVFNGNGSALTTGIKGDGTIDFSGTIQQWTLLGDQTGSIVVDIWKDTYANYPPTVADSIVASAPPTVTTSVKAQSSTLTGWGTSITAGDTLRFNINSTASFTRVFLGIKCIRT